jgi:hypothetical protein
MAYEYEINDLAKEESWRMFRIIGELVEGFDNLSGVGPAVSIYGSARIRKSPGAWESWASASSLAVGRVSWRPPIKGLFRPGLSPWD